MQILSQLINIIKLCLHWYEFVVVRVDDGMSLQILVWFDMVQVDSGTS